MILFFHLSLILVTCMLNTRNHVWPHFQTPQSLSKTLHYESYFQLSSLCLEMWSNTVFHAIYCIFIYSFVYLFIYLAICLILAKGYGGVASIFQRGGHIVSNLGYSPDCHVILATCCRLFACKRLTKGGSQGPRTPPPPSSYACGFI